MPLLILYMILRGPENAVRSDRGTGRSITPGCIAGQLLRVSTLSQPFPAAPREGLGQRHNVFNTSPALAAPFLTKTEQTPHVGTI